jgi:hypothetical protein
MSATYLETKNCLFSVQFVELSLNAVPFGFGFESMIERKPNGNDHKFSMVCAKLNSGCNLTNGVPFCQTSIQFKMVN